VETALLVLMPERLKSEFRDVCQARCVPMGAKVRELVFQYLEEIKGARVMRQCESEASHGRQ
jgi:hypothetical protein